MVKDLMSSSLQQLENNVWPDSEQYASNLVRQYHELRKVPLQQLTVENLRMLIGQNIGLKYLVPLALGLLKDNPWLSGDFYEGDLLQSVLKIDKQFWQQDQQALSTLTEIIREMEERIKFINEEILPDWQEIWR